MSDTPIDYSDVQGTVLRGYRVDLARHFILKIIDSAAAKRLIGSMVDSTAGMPQITTAERWKIGAPLNEPNPDTFYGGGPEGYTDYPTL